MIDLGPVGKAESVDLEKPESMEITQTPSGDKPISDEVLDEIEVSSFLFIEKHNRLKKVIGCP